MGRFHALLVGPENRSTGGVARYVEEQQRHLPSEVRTTVHDDGTTDGSFETTPGRSIARSVLCGGRFPFESKPDAVHVHTSHGLSFYRASWYVFVAAYGWDCPVVLHVHGSSFDDFVETDDRLDRRLQARVFDACDAVVVLSEYWRRRLATVAPESKLRVIPNAVDVTEYDPSSEEADVPTVAFVSNHVERKGIVDLVEAIDRIKGRDGPRFDVRIAGDGPLSHHARELAERYEEVEYLGYVSEAEKRRLLERSSVYALPSYAEGLPIGLLEGMAGGNAVVSTDVGSIPSVVGDENGRLISPGDVDALADALEALVSDGGAVARMGETNHRRIAEQYSWSVVTDRLLDLYESVGRQSPGRRIRPS